MIFLLHLRQYLLVPLEFQHHLPTLMSLLTGRIRASDEIRVLDEQIIKLKDLNDPSKILYFAKNNLSSLPIFDANTSEDSSSPKRSTSKNY